MSGIEKFMAGTLFLMGLGLILTNPAGDKAAGSALGNLYQSIVGAFYKPK